MVRRGLIDTSVLLLLGVPDSKAETRRARAVDLLREHVKKGLQLYVPTPVIAELCKTPGNKTADVFVAQVMQMFGGASRMRVSAFDYPAAQVAYKMLYRAIKERDVKSVSKVEAKFDAQIASIAIARKYDAIYTANATDFRRYLGYDSEHSVEVVAVDEIPEKGQLRLVDMPEGKDSEAGLRLTGLSFGKGPDGD